MRTAKSNVWHEPKGTSFKSGPSFCHFRHSFQGMGKWKHSRIIFISYYKTHFYENKYWKPIRTKLTTVKILYCPITQRKYVWLLHGYWYMHDLQWRHQWRRHGGGWVERVEWQAATVQCEVCCFRWARRVRGGFLMLKDAWGSFRQRWWRERKTSQVKGARRNKAPQVRRRCGTLRNRWHQSVWLKHGVGEVRAEGWDWITKHLAHPV